LPTSSPRFLPCPGVSFNFDPLSPTGSGFFVRPPHNKKAAEASSVCQRCAVTFRDHAILPNLVCNNVRDGGDRQSRRGQRDSGNCFTGIALAHYFTQKIIHLSAAADLIPPGRRISGQPPPIGDGALLQWSGWL
jgi:hypothetical protein